MYIELENYMCAGCRNDGRCGGCPDNDNRIREWNDKYGCNDSQELKSRMGYGFNIIE